MERNAALAAEAEKYKSRYKKLCELLKDAEIKEKAALLVQVDKGQQIQDELSQVCQIHLGAKVLTNGGLEPPTSALSAQRSNQLS